jgi:hypothetical protein
MVNMMYNIVFPTESRDVTLSDFGKIETEKPVAVYYGGWVPDYELGG